MDLPPLCSQCALYLYYQIGYSAPCRYITKLGRFKKPVSSRIFGREHVTTAFYTRSKGLISFSSALNPPELHQPILLYIFLGELQTQNVVSNFFITPSTYKLILIYCSATFDSFTQDPQASRCMWGLCTPAHVGKKNLAGSTK